MARIMYVAHEMGGDIPGNTKRVLEVCKNIHTDSVIPFAPYLLATQYLRDDSTQERDLGIAANAEFFKRGIIDEVGVFGSTVSPGVFGEMRLALELGIPVTAYDSRVRVEVDYAMKGLDSGISLLPYVMAERKLRNGNTLFLRRDSFCEDIALIESETIRDLDSGRDVTRFVPSILNWDEIFRGWTLVDKAHKHPSQEARHLLNERIFDEVADRYQTGHQALRDFDSWLPYDYPK